MGTILILPEIVALSGSGSVESLFRKKWSGIFGLLDEAARFCIGVEPSSTVGHMPNLYCGQQFYYYYSFIFLNRRIGVAQRFQDSYWWHFFFVSFANNKLDFYLAWLSFPDGLPARRTFYLHFTADLRLWQCGKKAIAF